MVSDAVAVDILSGAKGAKGASAFYSESPRLSPAGTLILAPGATAADSRRALERAQISISETYEGDPSRWFWQNFDNLSRPIPGSSGESSSMQAAARAAAKALTQWVRPALDRYIQGSVGKQRPTKAELAQFELAAFSKYDPVYPGSPSVRDAPGTDGQIVVVTKVDKDVALRGDPTASASKRFKTVYTTQLFTSDGRALTGKSRGKSRIELEKLADRTASLWAGTMDEGEGPKKNPLTTEIRSRSREAVENAANVMGQMIAGERDYMAAPAVRRTRLRADAERTLSKGIPKRNPRRGGVSIDLGEQDLGEVDPDLSAMIGLPGNDPQAAWRMGYYMGIMRGIEKCTPMDVGTKKWRERRAFKKDLPKKVFSAYNALAQSLVEGEKLRMRQGVGR
jgi:hypothetical protein